MTKYLFIVKNSSFKPSEHYTSFASDEFDAAFVGVPSVEQACLTASEHLNCGVDMIDLCSGFTHEDALRVFKAIGGKIKVSYAGNNLN